VNGFDESPVTFDVRAPDHFRYAAQDDNVRFAVRDCLIHFVFSIPAFTSRSRKCIDL
jgi:hypothetical protein